jgi:hypothetical protein
LLTRTIAGKYWCLLQSADGPLLALGEAMIKLAVVALGATLLFGTLTSGCAAASGDEDSEDVGESGDALTAPGANGFALGSDTHERASVAPITSNGNDWRVVYSVPVSKLSSSERVAVRGEVTLSMCAPSEGQPCNRPTPFSPSFTAKIVLGSSAKDVSGPNLAASPSITCSRRDHHGTLVIDESVKKGLSGNKFVNLVVAAKGNGNSQDLMKVEQAHGGVYVTRIGASADANGTRVPSNEVAPSSMKIDNVDTNGAAGRRDPHVLFRARLDNAQPGDLVDVSAVIHAKINDGACDPLIMHQVFVSKNDNDDPESSRVATVTAQNGTNCTGSACTYKKSGAAKLPAGTPSTVYVSVVAKAGRSCVQSGDSWSVAGGSDMTVRVRR